VTSSSLFATPNMSSESRGTGDDAIEELEPREEWPLEKVDAVGEDRLTDEVEDGPVGASASGVYTAVCSMLS